MIKNIVKSFIVVIGEMIIFGGFDEIDPNKNILLNNPIISVSAFIGMMFFFHYLDSLKIKTKLLQKILSLFFAVCTWFMTIYGEEIQSVEIILKKPVGIWSSIFFIVSFYFIIDGLQKILSYYYNKKSEDIQETNRVILFFDKHSFIVSFVVISFVWLAVAWSAYPSVFMGDSLGQLEQYFSLSTRTAAHPVASTLFIGSFVKIGQLIGDANKGLFLYTVFQIEFVAFCLAFAINTTNKLTKKSCLLLVTSFILAIIPMTNGTVILATKDIMFSGFFVLFMITLIAYFYDKEYYKENLLYIINLLSVIFMMLFRYNTLQFIGLSIIVYIIFGIIMKKKFYKVTSITMMMCLGLIIGHFGNTALSSAFAEAQPKPNRREKLSLPFQHTARYAKYYDNEVSDNDKKVINKVLNYDVIKNSYDPYRSDVVKVTHNEEANSKEMGDYFKLVGRQIIKHPLLAIESIMVTHSNLFNLNNVTNGYYTGGILLGGGEEQLIKMKQLGIKDEEKSLKNSTNRVNFYRVFDRLPVLSQLDNYAFYVLIFLSTFVLWIINKKYYFSGIAIPVGAFLGTLIAGPITLGYIRYILPIVFVSPLMLIFCLSTNNIEKSESKNEISEVQS